MYKLLPKQPLANSLSLQLLVNNICMHQFSTEVNSENIYDYIYLQYFIFQHAMKRSGQWVDDSSLNLRHIVCQEEILTRWFQEIWSGITKHIVLHAHLWLSSGVSQGYVQNFRCSENISSGLKCHEFYQDFKIQPNSGTNGSTAKNYDHSHKILSFVKKESNKIPL